MPRDLEDIRTEDAMLRVIASDDEPQAPPSATIDQLRALRRDHSLSDRQRAILDWCIDFADQSK